MSCCCKQKLLDVKKLCPRQVGDIQRKPINHPDYFGADEFRFIQNFGGDMRRNLQQIRHLKATSTGTAKTLDWLLQGNLEDDSKACLCTAGRRKKGAGKLLHGTRSRRAFGSIKSGGRRMSGSKQGLHIKGELGRPMIPLTFCFNESGHPISCDPRYGNEKDYDGNYLPGHWLRSAGVLGPQTTFQTVGDQRRTNPFFDMVRRALHGFADEKALWLELIKKQGGDIRIPDGDFRRGVDGGATAAATTGGIYHQADLLFTNQRDNYSGFDARSYANLLKAERDREKERLRALKSIYTDLNMGTPMDGNNDEEDSQRESDIYQFYSEIEEAIKEEMRDIKRLDFSTLIQLLKKDRHTKFEPVLYHEPFDPEKPWTWMKAFPKDIPERYLKRLSDRSLQVLRDWQVKQKLTKAARAAKAEKPKMKAAFKR